MFQAETKKFSIAGVEHPEFGWPLPEINESMVHVINSDARLEAALLFPSLEALQDTLCKDEGKLVEERPGCHAGSTGSEPDQPRFNLSMSTYYLRELKASELTSLCLHSPKK